MRKFVNAIDIKVGESIMFGGPKIVVSIEIRRDLREVRLQLEGYRSTLIKNWYDKVVKVAAE